MQKINVAFFTNRPNITVLEYLRVIGPVAYTDMNLLICHKDMENVLEAIDNAHLLVIQRDFPNDYDFFKFLLKTSEIQNKPIIYDLDDNLFDLPRYHPDRLSNAFVKALMPMLDAAISADYITVSNKYLKESLSELNKNIFVLPNYLDDRLWTFKSPIEKKPEKQLTLGYMGSDSHKPDIEYVSKVLIKIKEEYSEKIRFHFYGIKPPNELLSFSDTIWTPIKTYQYDEFAKDFQKIDIDFFIAPLLDNNFNRSKSPIKFFEYSSFGAPGVFSRIQPYNNLITDGKNGFLASSTNEWEEKIRNLIHDAELRFKLSLNAQNLVKEKYLMSQNSSQWKETYEKFVNLGTTDKNQNKVSQEIIKSVSHQLSKFHNNQQEKIEYLVRRSNQTKLELKSSQNKADALKKEVKKLRYLIDSYENEKEVFQNIIDSYENKIIAFDNKIEVLEQEVLFYALSKSWYLTRPLRKIKKLIENI
jgi:glycosyltransferase involved in cell wall biosynthesis